MMKTDKCPACGVTWQGEDIADHFEQTVVSREKAEVIAAHYGWSPQNRIRFQENVVGIETEKYDGVSQWYCTECDKIFDRWTGEEL